jgi:uncharacterized membrane protein required for colicin V production
VPQIDTPLLLDILLGLIILLFVPFGIRRGVAKEAMVSAGILLGATLAERFAAPWSAEAVARFGLAPDTATFAVSALLLLGSTFLLGYGGGAALGPVRPGTFSRLTGALLAAFNAGLLLSYLLGWIDRYLRQGAALADGVVSGALLHRADLLLIGAAGILLALVVLGWIVNAARSRRQPRAMDGAGMPGMPPRQRPVRVASAPDAGKYEPGPEPVARSGRFGQGLDATSPLPAGGSLAGLAARPGDGYPAAANGHGQSRGTGGQSDETVWAAWAAPTTETPLARAETTGQWPVAPSVGVTDDARCAVCHAKVGPRDVFCPECGATL